MSTTIDVFPTSDFMPLVDSTRARTQELFNNFLRANGIDTNIEVRAFYPGDPQEVRYVPLGTRWEVGMELGFAYWIDGKWISSSFPSCFARELVDEWDIQPYGKCEAAYPPEMLGQQRPLDRSDFPTPIPDDAWALMNEQDHYWYEYRSIGTHALASTGYGFVCAALAESTEGRIFSDDGAFDWEHSGQTAEQFLMWWGQDELAFYGVKAYQTTSD